MMDQVNLSRLSHGFRAAGMMRRCLNEALQVARHRHTFGRTLIDHPLARRQLLKLMVPTEQALSVAIAAAVAMTEGDEAQLRILTPLVKYRACRDNVTVATGAMEMRGGNGYIEEWIEPRLLRESHLGSIWEGTSNIIALDVMRAAAKTGAHRALGRRLAPMIGRAPADLAARLSERLEAALALIDRAAAKEGDARAAREAATGLYHATAAALFVHEAEQVGDAVRLDLAGLVLAHKLSPRDPLAGASAEGEAAADRVIDALAAARARLE
jgi:hypothetical protein